MSNPLEIFDRVMSLVQERGLYQCRGMMFKYPSHSRVDPEACCIFGAIHFAQIYRRITNEESRSLSSSLQEVCPMHSLVIANDDLGWTFEQFREALAASLER